MSRRRASLALTAVVAVALLGATPAWGHAALESSSPERGAALAREPAQVAFRFDEPVESNFGAVRVFDSRGQRVDEGDAFHPGGSGAQVAVRLRPGLPDGTYTATYRVVSTDGHIVSGGVVFSVGHATVAGRSVSDLLAGSGTGPVTSTVLTVARAVQYAALGVAGGTLLLVLVLWPAALRRRPPPELRRRCAVLVLSAAVAGTVSALAGVVLQGAEAAGVTAWSALSPHILHEALGTRFGTTWWLAAAAWLVAGVLALAVTGPATFRGRVADSDDDGAAWRGLGWLLAVPVGYLLVVPALSGHASTQSPTAVLFPANVLHVAAMTAWLGGLVALLVAVPAATRALAPAQRTPVLAAVLERFSMVALVAVATLLLTGLVQAYITIREPDLVFSTAFGRAAFIKLVLLAVLIGLGALNRRRNLPRLRAAAAEQRSPGADGVLLRRTLRAEVALIAVALAVTGALAGYPPPISAQSGPFTTTTRVGPQELQLTLDPARVGANEVHLYLTDPRTGVPVDTAKEVGVAAALPSKGIGAIHEKGEKAGPGHYVVPRLPLGVAGTWELHVTVRVSDFDQFEKRLAVRVR